MSSLRDYQRDSAPMISINIPSLREFLKQSGTDDMFIAKENTTTHQQSRRDDMFIASKSNVTREKSGTAAMFIANIINTTSNMSIRDETAYIPYFSEQPIFLDFGIPKNNNIFPWILKPINVSSLRDYQWDPVPMISINIPSLREFLKQSGTDDMFIAQRNTTTHQQSRRDDMSIASKSNVTREKSGTDDMFIASEYAIKPHKSHRDEISNIPYISQQSISPDFGILKNGNFLHWILKSINVPSLRDFSWVSVPSISINISSLREYIKKSGTDAMFIASLINHLTNSPLNHIPFLHPTPFTYARIL